MNIFEQLVNQKPKCEICGGDLVTLYGGGFENDIIYCRNAECGAEYNFPTSTVVDE